jgi:hypothetical protein
MKEGRHKPPRGFVISASAPELVLREGRQEGGVPDRARRAADWQLEGLAQEGGDAGEPLGRDLADSARTHRRRRDGVVGQPARLILFAARTLNELMCRPQSDRIGVNQGRRVTDPLPDYAELDAIM